MARAAFNKKTLISNKLALNLTKKLVKCCIWNVAFCGAGALLIKKLCQKYLANLEL